VGTGTAWSFSKFPSVTQLDELGLLLAIFHEPSTEYHPSLSRCSGISPSPASDSSMSNHLEGQSPPSLRSTMLGRSCDVSKKKQALTYIIPCNCNLM